MHLINPFEDVSKADGYAVTSVSWAQPRTASGQYVSRENALGVFHPSGVKRLPRRNTLSVTGRGSRIAKSSPMVQIGGQFGSRGQRIDW